MTPMPPNMLIAILCRAPTLAALPDEAEAERQEAPHAQVKRILLESGAAAVT